MSPATAERLGIPCKPKENPYPLVTISGDPVSYGNGVIRIETEPLELKIEGRRVVMSFDILPLGNDEAVLGMPWLREYNPKIDWITGRVDIKDTRRRQQRTKTKMVWYQVGATFEEAELRLDQVPERYHKFAKLWGPNSERLAEHAPWDHEIELEPGTTPKFFPVYKLTETENAALREFVKENLRKGYIRPSQSSAGYPVLFVPKKNGKLRMCIDYRQLNSITKKDRYPLPLISEIQDRIGNAKIFTKIDLRWAYHQIRIKEGDEWKAAFRSKKGLYEPVVMQFGLTNAPATFQKRINQVLGEHLDEFVMAYLDDIIIYSETEEEHYKHVEWVLQRLADERMPVAIEKCEFHTTKTEFCGFIMEPGKLSIDPKKIEAVLRWQKPSNVTELRSFLGFCNYCRRFMKHWSDKVEPFTKLTRKDEPWTWGQEQELLFEEIKNSFAKEPVLRIYVPSLPTKVETDASDYALGAYLAQLHPDGWHPVAYYSRKMTPAELNYDIYNKELLGIVAALKEWRAFLHGTTEPFKVVTDHKNLTGFLTTKELNRRQVRWAEELAEYHFEIEHTKGTENARADALSRKTELQGDKSVSGAILRMDTDGRIRYNHPQLKATSEAPKSEWSQRIKEAQEHDPDTEYYKDRESTYVPRSVAEEFVKEFHRGMTQGHNGATALVSRLQEEYVIHGIWKIARQVTKECPDCQRNKPARHKPYGGLQPVELAGRPWEVVSWDFIVKLPKSKDPITGQEHDTIFVIVDKFTKWGYFVACTEEISAEDVAQIYMKEVFARHGAPDKIISDRDVRFVAAFWEVFMAEQGIKAATSTAYHPQTDGQTERLNQTLEQYLRHYVNYAQNNWAALLPVAQFAYNATPQEGLGTSPFKATYGYEPKTSLTPRQAKKTSETAKEKVEKLMQLHQNLQKTAKLVQERMKKYYDQKVSEGPDLKEGDKVYLLTKNFESKRPSKKLDHVRMGPFKIVSKVTEVSYRLDLPPRMKIHPVHHVAMLEPAHGNHEPPVYEQETYRGQEQDEWPVKKILQHDEVDGQVYYEVQWDGYQETTWEPEENLEHSTEKVKEYYQRLHQATLRKKGQTQKNQLKATSEPPEQPVTPPPRYSSLSVLQPQDPLNLAHEGGVLWTATSHEPSRDGVTEREQPDERQEYGILRRASVEPPRGQSTAHPQVSQQQIEPETLRQLRQGSRRLQRIQRRARSAAHHQVFAPREWGRRNRTARNVHSFTDTERTLQEARVFALVHSEQEEGWRPDGAAIATHTNPFFAQREQGLIISPSREIDVARRARRSDAEDLIGGIRNEEGHQVESGHSTPLIDDLEMEELFEDEDEEEGAGVTDLISRIVQVLRGDLYWVRISAQEAGLMEPVEPWDEG
jgi:transposase InsO family protein